MTFKVGDLVTVKEGHGIDPFDEYHVMKVFRIFMHEGTTYCEVEIVECLHDCEDCIDDDASCDHICSGDLLNATYLEYYGKPPAQKYETCPFYCANKAVCKEPCADLKELRGENA